jgi:hypothetical protein
MASLRKHHVCTNCEGTWISEPAVAHAEQCPFCRAHDMTPARRDERRFAGEPEFAAAWATR